MSTGTNLLDTFPEGRFGHAEHFFNGGRALFANNHSEGGIGKVSLIPDDHIKGDFVPVLEAIIGRGAMDELFISRNTDSSGELLREKVIGDSSAALLNFLSDPSIN